MIRRIHFFLIVISIFFSTAAISQQIGSGTYNVTSASTNNVTLTSAATISVTSIGTAIDALNTYGVQSGGTVEFDFADNYIENATGTNGVGTGNYTLGTTTAGPVSALYSTTYTAVIFKHNGTGTKPRLYPYASASSGTDYMIRLLSVNNITFDGIDLTDNTAGALMEYGFKIETSTTGCTGNTIKNCKITMNRNNYTNASTGIYQTNSLSTGGYNSFNTFFQDTIYNSYRGMYINGNSVATDIGNVIKRCVIGDATYGGGDIGSNVSLGSATSIASTGITLDFQQDVTIAQNQIRDVTYFGKGVSTGISAGLYATNITGTSYIKENDIHSIKSGTGSTSCKAYGIYLSGSSGTAYIYTNFISDITPPPSGSSGTNAYGIYLPGNASGNTVGIYNNSINFCGTSVQSYTACLEIGNGSGTNGPTVDVKSNLFRTSTQTASGSRKFYGISFISGTLTSSYNMFGGSSGIYYTGAVNGTTYSTVATWNAATGQDNPATSNNTVPGFTSNTDLHLNFTTPNSSYQGVTISTPSITRDIDTIFHTTADPLLYPYMGADQFTNATGIIIAPNQPSDSIVNQTSSPQVLGGMIFTANGVSTTFTGLTVNSSGSYITNSTTDFSKFKLWIGSSSTFNSSTFTLLATASVPASNNAPAVGGAITFTGFTSTITSGNIYYVFITDSVGANATLGDKIGITTTAFSNITFTGGVSKIGTDPVAASGYQIVAKYFYNYGNAYGSNYADITDPKGWYEANTGLQPIDFITNNQVFQFIHNGSVMGDSTGNTSWVVNGTNTKVIVGDGVNTITFPAKRPVITTGGAIVDVKDKGVLKLQSNYISGTVLGTLDAGTIATPGSTVEYGDSGTVHNDTLLTPTVSTGYCNLTLSGTTTAGARVFPSSVSISRVFTPNNFTAPSPLKGMVRFNGSLVTQTIPCGFTFRGLQINNSVGATSLLTSGGNANVSVDSLLYIKTALTIPSGDSITMTSNASDTIAAVFTVNGTLNNNNPSYSIFKAAAGVLPTNLLFNANSNYNLSAALGGTTGGQIPSATWAATSNINITNVTAVNSNISLDSISAGAPTAAGFGNIYFDAPSMSGSSTPAYSLFSGFINGGGSGKSSVPYIVTIQGNLVLGRTNNKVVYFANTVTATGSTSGLGMNISIGGNLVQYAGSYTLANSGTGSTTMNMTVTGKDSINGSSTANPLYGTTGYYAPVYNLTATNADAGNLYVAKDFIMTGSSTIQETATSGSPGTLIFNGSGGNQNAQFATITNPGGKQFSIEVWKNQVSGGGDTVKLLSNASADTLRLTKGVLSIGSNTMTVNYQVQYRNSSSGAYDGTGTGTLAGSTSSNLNIGNTGQNALNPTLKFATNTAGSPYNNYLYNFTLVGTSTATLGNALNIAPGSSSAPGCVTVNHTGTGLTTGGFLTLKSNSNGTARVGANTSSSTYISGNVVIERFIQAHRAWRLLTAPISGNAIPSALTINATWQEGATNTVRTSPINPNPGFGTEITNLTSTPSSTGYDKPIVNNPSLLYLNAGAWTPPANTSSTNVNSQQAFMVFVRGSRSIVITTAPFATPDTTVLRTTGTLKEGSQSYTVSSTGYQLFGNPYASELSLDNIFASYGSVIGSNYVMWDPLLAGSGTNGVGGYVYASYSPGPSYSAFNVHVSPFIAGRIESGAGFFFYAVPGTFNITESNKSTSSPLVFRPANTDVSTLSTQLNTVNTDGSLITDDGTLNIFSDQFSNSVNLLEDAQKIPNPAENLGLIRDGKTLAIEKRSALQAADTIFLRLAQLKQGVSYRFSFAGSNFNRPDLSAILEDTYTGTSTAISLTDNTTADFTVTGDAASQGNERFRIVFRNAGPLPVTYTNVKAWTQNKNVTVQWNVTNEMNISEYIVERSADGQSFTDAATVKADGINSYNWIDTKANAGDNYYRIRSIGSNGAVQYSEIVKVKVGDASSSIAVYPNPVKGGVISLQFSNMPKGIYDIRLLNTIGQELYNSTIVHNGGNLSQQVRTGNVMAKGLYQLEITRPDQTKITTGIIAQ